MAQPLAPKDAAALSVPFAVAVGTCYSFGYWGHFEINALQYVSLLDIAKLAVYPLLFMAFSAAITLIYSEVGIRHVLPPGAGAGTSTGRFIHRHWRLIVIAVLHLAVIAAVAAPDPWRWYVVGFLLTTLSPLLSNLTFFQDLVPNPQARSALTTQLILIPFLALATGKHAAIRAESGESSLYVDVARSSLMLEFDVSHPVVYLGRLGDSVVLFETKARRVVVVKTNDESPLVLRRSRDA